MPNIFDNIKKIRELKNYTQEYMAEQLGMTQAGYSKIEKGNSDISYSKLTEIAKIFDIEINDLLNFDSQRYFNSFNNVKGNNNGSIIVDLKIDEIKNLYQEKFELLNKLLNLTETNLNKYKEKFGDI